MENRTSHIERVRKHYESNRRHILTELDITTTEYNDRILEIGCRFLELYYPPINPDCIEEGREWRSRFYVRYSQDRNFWNWFRAEWKKREDEWLKYMDIKSYGLNRRLWLSETGAMVFCTRTDHSFHHNFIKHHGLVYS